MRRLRSNMRRLACDERGVSVIELAMIAPVIALMIAGTIDIARGISSKLTLEQATHRALERAAVGSVESDYNYLKPEVAAAAKIPEADVAITTWLECNRTRQTSFSGSCESNQMVSRYLEVRVVSSFRPSFNYGLIGRKIFNTRADGTLPLTGSATLRVQ